MAADPPDPIQTGRTTRVDSMASPSASARALPSGALAALPRSQRYQTMAPLAVGGMGEVVSALDIHLGREVAIKRLRAARPTEHDLGRFLREAKIQGRLDHPAIVPIHDLAVDDAGRPFFAMKQLAGVTLHDLLYRAPGAGGATRTRLQLLRAFVDVCLAVEFAHTRGVIHRDLKPGNVVFGDFGEVYVLDWGIARVFEATDPLVTFHDAGPAAPLHLDAEDDLATPATPAPSIAMTMDASGTGDGAIVGTPGYMAPEQVRADPALGPGADIYALGCILYEVLAGVPLHPRGAAAALASTLDEPDARPSVRALDRDVSPELDAICVRATAPLPADRFASARALGEAVQGYLDGDRDVALRRQLAARHLDDARAALAAKDDPSARRRIMRAAGAALALDPGSHQAADLVSALLLHPPADPPPEVRAELARADAAYARRHARLAYIAFLAYVVFIPPFLWVGVRDWTYLGIGYALLTVNLTWSHLTTRHPSPPPYRAWITAVLNAIVVAIFGRMLGPWIIAPGLAAITLAFLANHPHLRLTWLLTLIYAAAALGPWALEIAGVIQPTSIPDPRGFIIVPPALEVDVVRGPYLILGWVAGLIFIAGLVGHTVARRRTERESHAATQAWQLRQLVPELTAGATGTASTPG
jgi:eukaryotic-like serine/threonine-protein kinase